MVHDDGRPMMQTKRFHPINVVRWLAVVMLLTTWGLGITGFTTGNADLYRWAAYVFVVLLCVAFSPLIVFLIGSIIDRK